MPKERSEADRLFHVFTTWGRNEIVVKNPAKKPTMVVVLILFSL
jgi:hypothetical protein